jgi:hypothetical protein
MGIMIHRLLLVFRKTDYINITELSHICPKPELRRDFHSDSRAGIRAGYSKTSSNWIDTLVVFPWKLRNVEWKIVAGNLYAIFSYIHFDNFGGVTSGSAKTVYCKDLGFLGAAFSECKL